MTPEHSSNAVEKKSWKLCFWEAQSKPASVLSTQWTVLAGGGDGLVAWGRHNSCCVAHCGVELAQKRDGV